MPTNVTVYAVDGQSIIYFQDGSSMIVPSQTEHSFQIPTGGFCSISDPPEDVDQPPPIPDFVKMMFAFWGFLFNEMSEEMREEFLQEIQESLEPEVNPL